VRFPLPTLVGIAAALLLLSGCGGAAHASEATIGIRYSHFTPDALTATAGEPITIAIRNDDPIEHEWIIGTEEVHQRHRTGTEPLHDQVPTEVTVPAFTSKVTTITFDQPGQYKYICHLPGHEEYGMVGTLTVQEN
jgi:uncharacterized cupredoxin-like copper-binding protein